MNLDMSAVILDYGLSVGCDGGVSSCFLGLGYLLVDTKLLGSFFPFIPYVIMSKVWVVAKGEGGGQSGRMKSGANGQDGI